MLRLVNTHVDARQPASPRRLTRRAPTGPTVGPESDQIEATDPRWVFSVRVASMIEGGRAGVLRPERRERLTKTAAALGLRAFDAALIIAMVQDEARRGAVPQGYPPLTARLAENLQSVPAVSRTPTEPGILQRLAGVLLIAACMVAAGIIWLNSG